MVTKKHTPGPWWYAPNQGWNIKTICSDDICSVSHNDVGVEEMHANAHLIAAAPDMLDALEYLYTNAALTHGDKIVAREAIAKAKGEA